MPYVNVKMYPGRTEQQKRELTRRIVQDVMEVCGVQDPALVPVVIEEVARDDWQATVGPELDAKRHLAYNS